MTIANSEGLMSSESCLPLTPEEERETIARLTRAAEANFREGDVYYVVSQRWFKDWQTYVRMDIASDGVASLSNSNGGLKQIPLRPGKIDNSELLSSGTEKEGSGLDLRRNLQEQEDYSLLPQEVWKKLHEWYKGGPELPRRVISEGFNAKNLIIEVHPLCFRLIDARDGSQRTIRISRKASIGELYKMVCTILNFEPTKVEIWDHYDKEKPNLLKDFDQTLVEAELQMDQEILLKVKDDETCDSGMDSTGNGLALVPMEPSRSPTTIAGGPTFSNGYSTGFGSHFLQENSLSSALTDLEDDDDILSNGTRDIDRGLAGLHNLGNTCFMNSALQCLVHTPHLVQFFLQDYGGEINRHNPLGTQGELAISFGDLLRKLWSSGRTSYPPREFKAKLARFAPQFSGYNQHDSQELLAFLLDGLHEDLNRVRNKPYIEAKDANGRPDEEFADECWEYHKARNDSIIVDVCQGQYKSTLVCPVCSKVSVTFDPFMYLSLPLPSTVTRSITVTVFSGDGSALPMPFTVTVPKNGSCRDLSQALRIACCSGNFENLLLAEVFDNRIYRYLESFESLSGIKDGDVLVAYRLPMNYKDFVRLEIIHSRVGRFDSQYNGLPKLLGTPLVTLLRKGSITGAEIHAAVNKVLSPLLRTTASSSNQAKVSKDNGCVPNFDAVVPTDESNLCSSVPEVSASPMEIEDQSDGCHSFQLALTDEKGMNKSPISSDSSLSPGSCVRVLLEWSDEDHELYGFNYLEDLPDVYKPTTLMMKKARQESVNLFSCLEAFLKEEPLGPDDMWYCPSCKEHRQATKKLDLWRLPEVLVVHLKRFSYSRYMKNKLDTFVNFSIHNLDLSKYVKHNGAASQSNVYELYAVSNHYGGLGGGHYSAYAKLVDDESWYHFDDSHVSPVSEGDITTSAAYVLFYKRVAVNSGKNGEEPSSAASS